VLFRSLVTKDIDRQALLDHMASLGIPVMVYYPVPLHLQKAYIDPRYKPGDFPVTESLAGSVISLPMHSELDEEQLSYITSSLLEFINKQ
jgi:UDP-2-acetamido-2-deoxy-ribo-hexuluronate aminotransferase